MESDGSSDETEIELSVTGGSIPSKDKLRQRGRYLPSNNAEGCSSNHQNYTK